MKGFHHNALTDVPAWAKQLEYPYWKIRVEGRNKVLRRKYYRMIRAEKLRLVELGYEIELIDAICKYLISHKQVNAKRLEAKLKSPAQQLSLNFFT